MYGIEDLSGWAMFELENGWVEKVWMRDQEMVLIVHGSRTMAS